MRYLGLMFFISIAFIYQACESETLELPENSLGLEYHPLEMDKYWIYKVDSTIILNKGVTPLTSTSYIKEEITDFTEFISGDTTYVLTRSISDNPTTGFRVTDIWTIEKTNSNLQRREENLGFIKLIFPIVVGGTWNGNQFDEDIDIEVAQNTIKPYKEWEYKIKSDNASLTIDTTSYTKVVHVEQALYDSGIEFRASNEWYAEGIGMIKREMTILDSQCTDNLEMPWIDRAQKGFLLTQTLVDHN